MARGRAPPATRHDQPHLAPPRLYRPKQPVPPMQPCPRGPACHPPPRARPPPKRRARALWRRADSKGRRPSTNNSPAAAAAACLPGLARPAHAVPH
eukprot:scaffold1854_cov113-Isochrysis_galbana.AAC.16